MFYSNVHTSLMSAVAVGSCSMLFHVAFSENLHRTVEDVGIVEVLGCCYTVRGDVMEIRLSAAKLGRPGT